MMAAPVEDPSPIAGFILILVLALIVWVIVASFKRAARLAKENRRQGKSVVASLTTSTLTGDQRQEIKDHMQARLGLTSPKPEAVANAAPRTERQMQDKPVVPDYAGGFRVGDQAYFTVASSPSGKYKVGANDEATLDGHRTPGACALILPGSASLCFESTIRRANNPHVADNGVVIVENWGSDSSLGADLLCFSPTGERPWTKAFKANIDDSGISPDGTRAFVQTCSSDYEPHSDKLFFIDVTTGKALWKSDEGGELRFTGAELQTKDDPDDPDSAWVTFDAKGRLPSV
jgi:hypothetical protein